MRIHLRIACGGAWYRSACIIISCSMNFMCKRDMFPGLGPTSSWYFFLRDYCSQCSLYACIEIHCCTGSVARDLRRLLANGLGTTYLHNCHDNKTRRKRTGQYCKYIFTRKYVMSHFQCKINCLLSTAAVSRESWYKKTNCLELRMIVEITSG